MAFKDYTDKEYGDLTALRLAKNPRRGKYTYWVFRCSCGAIVEKTIHSVISGNSSDCGCKAYQKRVEHNRKNIAKLKTSDKTIALIKKLREDGLTYHQIKDQTGVSLGAISRYLNNKPLPKHQPKCYLYGCKNKARTNGLCFKHYQESLKQRHLDNNNICSVPGCNNPVRANNLCYKHYRNQYLFEEKLRLVVPCLIKGCSNKGKYNMHYYCSTHYREHKEFINKRDGIICQHRGCDRGQFQKGLCSKHYHKQRREILQRKETLITTSDNTTQLS